jgi:hypothetical protein
MFKSSLVLLSIKSLQGDNGEGWLEFPATPLWILNSDKENENQNLYALNFAFLWDALNLFQIRNQIGGVPNLVPSPQRPSNSASIPDPFRSFYPAQKKPLDIPFSRGNIDTERPCHGPLLTVNANRRKNKCCVSSVGHVLL